MYQNDIEVSIIIPVYNNANDLEIVLKAIKQQDYEQSTLEVIVIDNGSADDSPKVAKSFSFVTLLKETKHLNSPYSARNRGIEQANGNIIVLLDATCNPKKNWLKEGISCLRNSGDIVGGNVKFDFDDDKSAAKIYDSITNIKVKESIKERGVAPTANLFIKKSVFDEVGLFPEGIRSGGDLRWTKQATSKGFKLKFCDQAVTFKPARNLAALIKKQWRVSNAQPAIWIENRDNLTLLFLIKVLIGTLVKAPFISPVQKRLKASELEINSTFTKIKLEFLHYFISVMMCIGNIKGYLDPQKK